MVSMKTKLAELTKVISEIPNHQYAALTYEAKKDGGVSHFTVHLGFSYHDAVVQSVQELEVIMDTLTPGTIQYTAAEAVMASLKKTLEAHSRGEQNSDYTKAGQYVAIGKGLNLNTTDNTLQLFGLVQSKIVIKPGVFKKVNSAPLTIEKNKIRKQLSVGKFREFALDLGNILKFRANGNTVELESDLSKFKGVGFNLTSKTPATV